MLPLLVTAVAFLPQADSVEAATPEALFEFRVDPRLELWFDARSGVDRADSDPMADAAALARELERCFAVPRFCEILDATVVRSGAGTPLAAAFDELTAVPPRSLAKGVTNEDVRAAALALANVVDARVPGFVEGAWVDRSKALRSRLDELRAVLPVARQRDLAKDIGDLLDVVTDGAPVDVLLVTRMPPPGGVTLRTGAGRASCVVEVGSREVALLAEVVVHEALHALVARRPAHGGLFGQVSTRLEGAGVEDARARSRAVHVLYFIAAADLVAKHVDPEHLPYGVAHGVYERSRGLAEAALGPWARYRSGETDGAVFAKKVAEGWAPLLKRPKPGR